MAFMTGTFRLCRFEAKKSENSGITLFDIFDTLAETIDITNEADEWTIVTTNFKNDSKIKKITFKLGQQFDDTYIDDFPCKSVITQKGDDKLVQVQQNYDGGLISKAVRQFTGTGMKMTMKDAEGAAMTIRYKRLELD